MKRDYGTNGKNRRSAGFQRACFKDVPCQENKHAGSLRTGGFFRLFRNLSSLLWGAPSRKITLPGLDQDIAEAILRLRCQDQPELPVTAIYLLPFWAKTQGITSPQVIDQLC